MSIKSPYSPVDNKWHITWPGRISQHDIVYGSPPEDPVQGLPIGNGDMGCLLWTEESRLIMAINKCDIWDDNEACEFSNWGKDEEERHTSLRHCGRLVIDFSVPVFGLLYQDDFEGRLDLAGASAGIKAETPFAKVNLVSYASHEQRVIVLHCNVENEEDVPVSMTFERWGSRTLAHWYSRIRRNPSVGLSGIDTKAADDTIIISQKLRSMSFVSAIRIDTGGSIKAIKLHSRAGQFELKQGKKKDFYLYITVVSSENSSDPEGQAIKILDEAIAMGEDEIGKRHREEWKKFWDASFVSLPQNYIENIWHLVLYYANSSSRGEYPPHFCNGIWSFNRDFVPWNYYFHWNMQIYTWPLHAANHGELAMPYYKYRFKQLPHVKRYAEKYKNKDGAFYADVADRRGYNDLETKYNCTPGAQIALNFWEHYLYTGDENFLKELGWPVIREVAKFYASMVSQGDDGRYHIFSTQAYEGSPLFDDTITDISMIKVLFPAAVKAAELSGYEADEIEKWKDIGKNMADFHLVPLETDEYEMEDGRNILSRGLGKGNEAMLGKVFAVGKFKCIEGFDEEYPDYEGVPDFVSLPVKNVKKGEWLRKSYGNKERAAYYGIPDPEFAPVFPSGLVGLSEKESELYRASVDQIRLHPRCIPGKEQIGDMTGSGDLCMGWCSYPVVLARLGLSEELVKALEESISTWQFYCQGFGHYGPYHVFTKDCNLRWKTNTVVDADSNRKFEFPAWPFRHFDNEAMPIVSTAVNEMLLQSYDGVIRLCPAVPEKCDVRFKLAAVNGFVVHTEHINGHIPWISIESRLGKECRIVNPWGNEDIHCMEFGTDGGVCEDIRVILKNINNDAVIHFPTAKGCRYLIAKDRDILDEWEIKELTPLRNNSFKELGSARLGLPRMF